MPQGQRDETPSRFPRWLVGSIVGVTAVVCALSALVGHVGGEHGFGWELAAIFGTAVGTTLLAVTTGGLAYLTGRDVSATWELARLQRDDQVARERPTVLLHAASYEQDHVRLHLHNVGLGPAVNVRARARITTAERVATTEWSRVAAIQLGATPALRIEIDPHFRGLDRSEVKIHVEGVYTDRRQMDHYDVITEIPTGPMSSEPEHDE